MWQPCGCAARSRTDGSIVQSPKNSGGLSWLPRSPQKPKFKIPSRFLDLPHSWSNPVAVQPKVGWVALWSSQQPLTWWLCCPKVAWMSWLARSSQKSKSKSSAHTFTICCHWATWWLHSSKLGHQVRLYSSQLAICGSISLLFPPDQVIQFGGSLSKMVIHILPAIPSSNLGFLEPMGPIAHVNIVDSHPCNYFQHPSIHISLS